MGGSSAGGSVAEIARVLNSSNHADALRSALPVNLMGEWDANALQAPRHAQTASAAALSNSLLGLSGSNGGSPATTLASATTGALSSSVGGAADIARGLNSPNQAD